MQLRSFYLQLNYEHISKWKKKAYYISKRRIVKFKFKCFPNDAEITEFSYHSLVAIFKEKILIT